MIIADQLSHVNVKERSLNVASHCHWAVLDVSLAHSPPTPALALGMEPQAEKQVEKVSALGMVRRDTALLLRDFKQGASNWFQALLDPNRASAGTGIPARACLCVCVFARACVHVCVCMHVYVHEWWH